MTETSNGSVQFNLSEDIPHDGTVAGNDLDLVGDTHGDGHDKSIERNPSLPRDGSQASSAADVRNNAIDDDDITAVLEELDDIYCTREEVVNALREEGSIIDAVVKLTTTHHTDITSGKELRLRASKAAEFLNSVGEDETDDLTATKWAGLLEALKTLNTVIQQVQARDKVNIKKPNEVTDHSDDGVQDLNDEDADSSDGSFVSPRSVLVPEVRRVSWEAWGVHEICDRVSLGNEEGAAFEALEELPQRVNNSKLRPSRTNAKAIQMTTKLEVGAPDHKADALGLPERFRIRSTAVKRILVNLFKGEIECPCASCPIVFTRPFKVFVYASDQIIGKKAEIDALLKEKLKALSSVSNGQTEESNSSQVLDTDATLEAAKPNGPSVPDAGHETAATVDEVDKTLVEYGPSRYSDSKIFTGESDPRAYLLSELQEASDHLCCLTKFIEDRVLALRKDLRFASEVCFADLWHLYEVGHNVYMKEKSTPQKIWRVVYTTGATRFVTTEEDTGDVVKNSVTKFALACYYVDFDGSKWVQIVKRFEIEPYIGSRPILSLPIYPFYVAEREGLVDKTKIMKRGQDFIKCRTPRHIYYSGRSLDRSPTGERLERYDPEASESTRVYSQKIESQVVVDFERALERNQDWKPRQSDDLDGVFDPVEPDAGFDFPATYIDDRKWDAKIMTETMDEAEDEWQMWERGDADPSGDDVLLLPERVFAFILRSREWACISCGDGFEEIKQNKDAWDALKIPESHRNIVQSLVQNHFAGSKDKGRVDWVRDKGKGVVVLLHGVPGVGKTSTAECVAETYKKPLLPITCGDLGLTAEKVEKRLQDAFALAQAWDCVMLLDEADVFLAERTSDDIERNALVSVFLRVLEYYEGILFLTTNRVGSFDEAFKSRIHMSLYYAPLDQKQTRDIWASHIQLAAELDPPIVCNGQELLDFADRLFAEQRGKSKLNDGPVWNGRQIRNAFQSAIALARYQSAGSRPVPVSFLHFMKVAEVSNDFDAYLARTRHGLTEGKRAYNNFMRYDNYGATDRIASAVTVHTAEHTGTAYGVGPNAMQANTSGGYQETSLSSSSRAVNPQDFQRYQHFQQFEMMQQQQQQQQQMTQQNSQQPTFPGLQVSSNGMAPEQYGIAGGQPNSFNNAQGLAFPRAQAHAAANGMASDQYNVAMSQPNEFNLGPQQRQQFPQQRV